MATAAITYTFVANTLITASEANTNFQDLVDFLNQEVVHKDGSVAFTAHASGPASNPTTDNQYSRKAFVDAGDLARVKRGADTMAALVGGSTDFTTKQLLFQGGYKEVLTDGNGFTTVTFPTAFPTGLLTFVACGADYTDGPCIFSLGAHTAAGADVYIADDTGGPRNTETIKFAWLAVGW